MKELRFTQNPFLSVTRQEYFTLLVSLAISFVFLFSNHNPQVERLRTLVIGAWGYGLKAVTWYQSMQDMQEELSRLRARTTRLLLENSQLREAALENARLRAMLEFKQKSTFDLVSARVLARSAEHFVKTLTLDVGTRQGVQKNMPVIAPAGLVGKILAVSGNTSEAQLVLDHNFRAACKIQRSRINGILVYEGGRTCRLTQVPKNADVKLGDVVITSEISGLFPTGIIVGVVKKIKRSNSTLFLDIEVEPAVDFDTLEEVFVIKSSHKPIAN